MESKGIATHLIVCSTFSYIPRMLLTCLKDLTVGVTVVGPAIVLYKMRCLSIFELLWWKSAKGGTLLAIETIHDSSFRRD